MSQKSRAWVVAKNMVRRAARDPIRALVALIMAPFLGFKTTVPPIATSANQIGKPPAYYSPHSVTPIFSTVCA
ncbi:hypothetical protein DOU54_12980 [Agrobacterium sp. MS2]|nr:hypothetical protein DOU54_12980 [Agrobacterium sp. MS2]